MNSDKAVKLVKLIDDLPPWGKLLAIGLIETMRKENGYPDNPELLELTAKYLDCPEHEVKAYLDCALTAAKWRREHSPESFQALCYAFDAELELHNLDVDAIKREQKK